jgi:CBS domain-containing protein
VDIASFLRRYPPFDALSEERLRAVANATQIEHFPLGTVILRQAGEPATHLFVVRRGEVELVDDGRLLDLLGEGEVFGQFSLLAAESPTLTVRAREDTLCYLIDPSVADDLLETNAGMAFVVSSMRRRVRRAAEAGQPEAPDPRLQPVASLLRRSPVTVAPGTTVAVAAGLMAAQRVSCLPVAAPGAERPLGILTDRDLRSRVVAARRSSDTPVEEVATFPVVTLPQTAMAGEALLAMFEYGFHHLPVVDGDGRLVGIVTDTDLLDLGRHTPFAIKSAIERAADRDAAVTAARDLPAVVTSLVAASADPVDTGRVVSLVVDALTSRLLRLGQQRLGEAPAPWAWLALGSAARHEQSLVTDQDHAFAHDGDAGTDAWFAELAGFVTDGLEAAGIPRCKGDAMAVHPQMRRSLSGWVDAMRGWMDDPGPDGSILSSIVFDYRRVAGPLDAEPALDGVVREARAHPQFLRHLGRRALSQAPPTGFFRDLVVEAKGEHAGRLDVKRGGLTIVANLARAYATGAGLIEKRTIERLTSAADRGAVDATISRELTEAFHFLWEVRLTHQANQIRAGESPDDFVDPATLGPVARRGLKEAFRSIARAQRALAAELGVRPA